MQPRAPPFERPGGPWAPPPAPRRPARCGTRRGRCSCRPRWWPRPRSTAARGGPPGCLPGARGGTAGSSHLCRLREDQSGLCKRPRELTHPQGRILKKRGRLKASHKIFNSKVLGPYPEPLCRLAHPSERSRSPFWGCGRLASQNGTFIFLSPAAHPSRTPANTSEPTHPPPLPGKKSNDLKEKKLGPNNIGTGWEVQPPPHISSFGGGKFPTDLSCQSKKKKGIIDPAESALFQQGILNMSLRTCWEVTLAQTFTEGRNCWSGGLDRPPKRGLWWPGAHPGMSHVCGRATTGWHGRALPQRRFRPAPEATTRQPPGHPPPLACPMQPDRRTGLQGREGLCCRRRGRGWRTHRRSPSAGRPRGRR